MAVINVTHMWSKSGGNFTSDKYFTYPNKISMTEGFQVLAEVGDDAAVVAQASDLPNHGDQHPSGQLAFVTSIDPTPLGPFFWLVVVSYSGDFEATSVDVEWTDTTTTEPIDRDYDGAAILTVNGEPVDGLSVDVADQVAIIKRQFVSINTASIAMYRRATNSDTYLGWPPGTGRLIGFSASNRFKSGAPQEQWTVTARIQFRQPYANTTPAQAWYKRWRHEGLWIKAGTPPVIQRARDQQGQESPKPVLLKEDGTQETNPDNAIFFHTKVFDSLPYSGLGLL